MSPIQISIPQRFENGAHPPLSLPVDLALRHHVAFRSLDMGGRGNAMPGEPSL